MRHIPQDAPVDLDDATKEMLANKTGVMVAIPNLQSRILTPLTLWLLGLTYRTIDANCPWFFKLHLPNDLTPVEYARNECVREFLRDPYYKKLYFIDADMLPPPNALDLLMHDAPIVSGMCHIWMGGEVDPKTGHYVPPRMKINAFDYRPEHDDFISKIPPQDGRVFECDAVGAACMVIDRALLEDIPEPWFRHPRDPYGAGLRGEDLDFCRRANMLGRRALYVPTVQFGHVKSVDLGEVIKYGISSRRSLINDLKAVTPEKLPEIVASLPTIRFGGEAPVDDSLPKDLRVIAGGRK